MKNFSVAYRYNRWFCVGWTAFPIGFILFALSLWYLFASRDDYKAGNFASYLVVVLFALTAFSVVPILATRNGKGTLRTFRKAVWLIEENTRRRAAGQEPLKSPWELDQWLSTYCQRAGVKAAACELNVASELPHGFLKWWCIIETRSRRRALQPGRSCSTCRR